ncbi:aldehyde dehydrogenase family protein [Paenarthrobacter ureafaciens]
MTAFTILPALPVAPDPQRLERADEVIRSLNLPTHGIAVHDPATAETIAHVPDSDADGALTAIGKADAAGSAWTRSSLRQRADVLHAWYHELVAHRGVGTSHLTRDGQATCRGPGRGQVRHRLCPLVRRRSSTARRELSGHARRRRKPPYAALTRWAGGTDHALELPPGHGHPENRTGSGGGMPRRHQARDPHSPDDVLCHPSRH